jgi:hypothetical protein
LSIKNGSCEQIICLAICNSFCQKKGEKKVDKLETGNGETGIGLSEVSPLAVGLFTLVVSILLAGLTELVRTVQVTHL